MDIVEDILNPEVPNNQNNGDGTIYIPLASYDKPGAASFDESQFSIDKGKVKLSKRHTDFIKEFSDEKKAEINTLSTNEKNAIKSLSDQSKDEIDRLSSENKLVINAVADTRRNEINTVADNKMSQIIATADSAQEAADRAEAAAKTAASDAENAAEEKVDKILGVIEFSPNLIDPSKCTEKQYLAFDGTVLEDTTNNGRYITDYIPIKGGKTYYYIHIKNNTDAEVGQRRIAFYAADKSFIRFYDQDYIELVFTAPDNATYLRMSNGKWCKPMGLYESAVDKFIPYYKNLAEDVKLVNHIDGTLSEKGKVADAKAVGDSINNLREQIHNVTDGVVTMRYEVGKNRYNCNDVIESSFIESKISGQEQTLVSEAGFSSQKVVIATENSYTLSSIVAYSLVDENNILLGERVWVGDSVYTLNKSNIPANTKYLWVTVRDSLRELAQIEIGTEATAYEPYELKQVFTVNGEVVDIGGGQSYVEEYINAEYDNNALSVENTQLRNTLSYIARRRTEADNLKSGVESNLQIITPKNIKKHKLILHIHRYANNGYDTTNDVFLPKALKNFGDIKITDNRGNTLPYFINKMSDFDVVADSRIHTSQQIIFKDRNGNLIAQKDDLYICMSSDNGENWVKIKGLKDIKAPTLVAINPDDSLLLLEYGTGNLLKSYAPYTTYETVLNFGDYTGIAAGSDNIKRLNDGSLILGAYQVERSIRLYKSTNNGSTWTKIYEDNSGKYQHVHNIYIDHNQAVETIYVGCDGGGGVLRSTDGGVTWTDLRTLNPDMPQSTDFGVVYAGNGFRLLSGETAIVGGHSIIRTEDDVNFTPILSVGHGIYHIRKFGDCLVGGTAGTYGYRTSGIVVSRDDGATWEKIYTTSPFTDSAGASDGFRKLDDSVFENTLIAYCQSTSRKAVRITKHNEPIYAEIIVDVPENTDSLTVENGYAIGNTTLMYNEYEPTNKKLLHYPLNEGNNLIKETVSGNILKNDYEYAGSGKHFGDIYPYITDEFNRKSVLLSSLKGFTNDITIPRSFTISFWGRLGDATRFNLVKKGSNTLQIYAHQLRFNDTQIANPRYPKVLGVMEKIDIAFDGVNKTIKCYTNGLYRHSQYDTVDVDAVINAFAGEGEVEVLEALQATENECIQHFTIYHGVLSETDILNSYHSEMTDNYQVY